LAIYLRQVKYRGRPLDNGLGSIHGMLLGAVIGAVALGFVVAMICLAMVHGGSDSYSGMAVTGALDGGATIGGIVGFAAGIVLGSRWRRFLKRNVVAYYAVPTIACLLALLLAICQH